MANLTMVFIFDEILIGLCGLGYAEETMLKYTRYFKKMQDFFLENGASEYSDRILDDYCEFVTQKENFYSRKHLTFLRKSVDWN